jgi:hypothetical protein
MIITEYLSSGLHGYSAVERLPSNVPCARGALVPRDIDDEDHQDRRQ